MITYVIGNLFESPARVLVNTVNTVGVMGKGIAKDFKAIYPEMFREYQGLCEEKKLTVGKLWLYKTSNKWILNFPTKTTWRQPSRIEYIESGLQAFVKGYAKHGITSIAFPPLGCGNGELNWEKQVRPLMEKYLNKLAIDVFIYLYKRDPFVPEHKDIKAMAAWLRSQPEALGFAEVWQDLTQLIGSGLSLRTLTNRETFQVDAIVNQQEEGIRLYIGKEEHFIPKEELLDLWCLIRTYGFSTDRTMPAGLEAFTDQLIALFSKLPYCRPVHVSIDYAALSGANSIGLRLVPRMQPSNASRKLPLEVRPA